MNNLRAGSDYIDERNLFMTDVPARKSKESDKALVRRFIRQNDGEAFSILMDRYVHMVYTTSWRILGDEALAADAVQETFFQLVKNADKITGSLGSWLHRVATRRAIDLIRQNISRRSREECYAEQADLDGSSWSEVEPIVDEALEELPEDLKELLLLHFMQGRSTIQIAAAQGVSQPTISRRLTKALDQLRQILRDRGIVAGLVPVQAVLLHGNQLAPEGVRASLGKIALVKAAGTVPMKIGLAACALAVGTSAVLFLIPGKNKNVRASSILQASSPAEKELPNATVQPETPLADIVLVPPSSQTPPPTPAPTVQPRLISPRQPTQRIPPAPALTNLVNRKATPPVIKPASAPPAIVAGYSTRENPAQSDLPNRAILRINPQADLTSSLYKRPLSLFGNDQAMTNYSNELPRIQSQPVMVNSGVTFTPARNSRSVPMSPKRKVR
jgi:RNA polymerase sigma factor (sigma-70 family)